MPTSKKSAHGHDTKHLKIPRNRCFGCGPDNPDGMHLNFTLDEQRKTFVCRFKLSSRYVGPPAHAHGGIIATILDEAMGKVNKLRHVVALTREMSIEYVKPVPLGKPLVVEGRERSVRGRVHTNVAEIRNQDGEVLARSKGKFIAINPEKMFKKYLKRMPGELVRNPAYSPARKLVRTKR
ncbi:MAG TPA: PaaI family thioesterase [Clostridia bacterium]|nr:PaaI family thioesterase [Clostridia bacterium]